MKILEPELGYDAACSKHHLDNTSVRRENLSEKFFTYINSASHRLHQSYRNRNRIDTPSGIHLNYLSRKPTPTGLRTL